MLIYVWATDWANMTNGLGNLAARDVGQLADVVRNRLKTIQSGPSSSAGSSPRPDSLSNPNRLSRPTPSEPSAPHGGTLG